MNGRERDKQTIREIADESDYEITGEREAREAFFEDFPEFDNWNGTPQNECPADVRTAWVDWLDNASRDGRMSPRLAYTVTL